MRLESPGRSQAGGSVESVHHDLVILVRLQSIYDQIARAIEERQTPPPEVEELQLANVRRQQELEELEQQIGKHQEELREVHKKEQEWTLELEHFQKQKGMVTNEREFTAVISEIDYATKALEEASQRRQELESSIEEISTDVASRRDSRADEEMAQNEVVQEWEQRKTELLTEVHELSTEAKRLEGELSPSHRARFLRLLESKKGTAMSAVAEGSCSVCHFAVRPHLRQRVRRCQEIITCEYCHRILFFADIIASEPSEATTG
jgi:predicted  nucleic acid-binding Zn-ribbon protein